MANRSVHIAELARFFVVGGSAVAVDFLVYFALVRFVPGVPVPAAKATSFIAGAVLAFFANRGFVFRADGSAWRQMGPFALLYLLSLGLNTFANHVALSAGANKLLAWFVATSVSTVSNFLGMKFVVFARRGGVRTAE